MTTRPRSTAATDAAAGTAPTRKERSHDRILDAAARALRRGGFGGVGVAEVMKDAGLTHGGFYAHFASRDALLAAALERAGRDSGANINQSVARRVAQGASVFRAFVESYLHDAHLASTEAGCPVAALGSEMARSATATATETAAPSDDLRSAARLRVDRLLAGVRNSLPADAPVDAAMVVAGTLVGALQLARTLGNNAQGRALLAASRQALLAQYDHGSAERPASDAGQQGMRAGATTASG